MTIALVVAALLAVGQVAVGKLRARHLGPAANACWIWAPMSFAEGAPGGDGVPVSFYAIGEVMLDAVPERARVILTADEDYRLYVNDRWVAGGRYLPGTGPDAYAVADRLRVGRNRLVVELRSSRAAGGLLAALVDGAGRPLLVTDDSWRIARQHDPALFEVDRAPAGSGLANTVAAHVWGEPPSGRWRTRSQPFERPAWFAAGAPPQPMLPFRGAAVDDRMRWTRIRVVRQRLPRSLGAERVVFDWGRPVEGVPILDLRETEPRPAVVRVAATLEELGDPVGEQPCMLTLPIDGAPHWLGAAPLRFRYLEVIGLALRRRPFVLPVAAGVEVLPAPLVDADPPGVFGLPSPWRPSRAKRAVLERVRSAAPSP